MWQWEEVLLELSHPLYNSHFALLLTLSPLQGIPGRCGVEQASPWLCWPQSLSSPEQPTSSCAWSNSNACTMASLTYLFFPPKDDKSSQELTIFIHPTDLDGTCTLWALCNSTLPRELDWSTDGTSGCFLPPSDKVRCCFALALVSASVPLACYMKFAAKHDWGFHLLSGTQ